MRRTAAAAVTTVFVLLIAGCTASSPDQPTRVEPSTGDVPLASAAQSSSQQSPTTSATSGAGTQTAAARYGPAPLQAYNLTAQESDTITKATDALVAACMTERGFTYKPTSQSVQAGTSNDWDSYLGVTDLDQAQQYGYRVPGATGEGGLSKEEQAILDQQKNHTAQDEAYQAALLGPNFPPTSDDSACYPKSNAQLIPTGTPPDLSIQSEIAEQAAATAAGDATVVAAKQTWTACMADQGYALDAIPLPSVTAKLDPDVIAQAVADVHCKDSSGLTDTYITTLYAAQKSLIQSRLTDLQAYQAYVDERLRLAADVLTHAG